MHDYESSIDFPKVDCRRNHRLFLSVTCMPFTRSLLFSDTHERKRDRRPPSAQRKETKENRRWRWTTAVHSGQSKNRTRRGRSPERKTELREKQIRKPRNSKNLSQLMRVPCGHRYFIINIHDDPTDCRRHWSHHNTSGCRVRHNQRIADNPICNLPFASHVPDISR